MDGPIAMTPLVRQVPCVDRGGILRAVPTRAVSRKDTLAIAAPMRGVNTRTAVPTILPLLAPFTHNAPI